MASTAAKIALVTGASSGIGRAAAISLNKAGWTVVVTARRKEALEETVSLMPEESREKSKVVVGDLANRKDVSQLFQTVKDSYGRLDLLFNNAGINTRRVPLDELDPDEFEMVLRVNLTAPFLCAQEAIKIMKAQEPIGGRIINNGSISAYVPRPYSAPYTASKHGISGLTKCIALDYREFNIACSQIDIGNAASVMSEYKSSAGTMQADGSMKTEPTMEASHTGDAVAYIASLPLHVNVLNQTIMATNMPFVGRG